MGGGLTRLCRVSSQVAPVTRESAHLNPSPSPVSMCEICKSIFLCVTGGTVSCIRYFGDFAVWLRCDEGRVAQGGGESVENAV